ncbi:hypothetical protein FOA43_001124 [Brettanomyces nanus]|uniref:protein disulfide-isomerase n=1 Tax=Eeniella nana TaxID=13502 RepID=A0A875RNJ3_EENNA|nr:uncharacterized protein FOA43_001124 [Brettanomyces nanus]QPG73810.1 hypothetical protein FOA43_001124 [Brettanomyces nanus]
MKSLLISLVGIASCFSGACALEVSDADFDDVVLNSNKTSFVKVYASWCSHCKELAPAWEALEKAYKDSEEIQFIEIDGDRNKKFSKRFNVDSFPALKLFKQDDLTKPIEYEGTTELESLDNFVKENTKIEVAKPAKISRVVKLDDSSFDRLVSKNHKSAFIFFSSQNCEDCAIWENAWEKLADVFHLEMDKVIIGEVLKEGDEPVDYVTALFKVTSYPTIVFVDKGNTDKPELFAGLSRIEDLLDFLNEKLHTKRTATGELMASAGTIPQMDELMINYVKADIQDRQDMVEDVITELKKVDSTVYKYEIKYYARIISVLLSIDSRKFVTAELERLGNLKKDKDLGADAADRLQMKLNMLQLCDDALNGKPYSGEDTTAKSGKTTKVAKEANRVPEKDEL